MHKTAIVIAGFLILLVAGCGPRGGGAATASPEPPPALPAANTIEILSVDPPAAAGLSASDLITLFLHYEMLPSEGLLQIWFERFADDQCTVLGFDDMGGSTLPGGTLEMVSGGTYNGQVMLPPIAPVDTQYLSVGVRLWASDSSAVLAEDMRYQNCFAVRAAPVTAPASQAGNAPAPGETSGTGMIAGTVYSDNNSNGMQEADEPGAGPYALILADISCTGSLTTTNSTATGHYSFAGLIPGTYCVILNAAGVAVLPGSYQMVDVIADRSSPAFFGLQAGGTLAPPPAAGYCGDGVLDTGAGEQCDPPNLTDCTATCQSYTGYCGNGIVDPGLGEQCDPPNTTDCTASCQTYTPYCGDWYVDMRAGEQCDPPNLTDCTAACQIYIGYCGNGFVDTALYEQCDPPNPDFCTAQCQLYLPNCGNYALDLGEECDPPNPTDCTAQCQIWP